MAKNVRNRYSSFGGVMLWDADTAYSKYIYFTSLKQSDHRSVIPSDR